jgi:hypothetical protein
VDPIFASVWFLKDFCGIEKKGDLADSQMVMLLLGKSLERLLIKIVFDLRNGPSILVPIDRRGSM